MMMNAPRTKNSLLDSLKKQSPQKIIAIVVALIVLGVLGERAWQAPAAIAAQKKADDQLSVVLAAQKQMQSDFSSLRSTVDSLADSLKTAQEAQEKEKKEAKGAAEAAAKRVQALAAQLSDSSTAAAALRKKVDMQVRQVDSIYTHLKEAESKGGATNQQSQDDERARKLIESKLAESKLGSGGSAADKRAALKQQRMGGAGGRVRSNSGNNGVSGVTSGSGKDDVSAAGAGITSRNAGLGSHAMLPGKEIADGGSGRDGGAAGKSADLHAHLDNNQVMAGRDPRKIEATAGPKVGIAGAVQGQTSNQRGAVDEKDGSSLALAHAALLEAKKAEHAKSVATPPLSEQRAAGGGAGAGAGAGSSKVVGGVSKDLGALAAQRMDSEVNAVAGARDVISLAAKGKVAGSGGSRSDGGNTTAGGGGGSNGGGSGGAGGSVQAGSDSTGREAAGVDSASHKAVKDAAAAYGAALDANEKEQE
mmetsp:Transcript_6367/g.18309  ORF Transcript_6367/g.18309 Transcript_6367/m.18309 type:complete len:477 (-) Transcript_6367:461-1891(-)|eukprot:CAMPEP_0206140406 /NCGR_PEP_ID=MMETSP1473-20131121/9331_1 /ASSEMBLY_ACC=CAM_ASM_001109 /TAXON_ID=1461547 /ORGANISM="Stichococcus sp, Strain RCC1054" /LENGTH=476 /DNA_ID=CAMNT_0053534543 /DNA_START=77 /DNA_END=1507 /DNA_ORIENTATION=+